MERLVEIARAACLGRDLPESLEPLLAERLAHARATWPAVELAAARFLAVLVDRMPAGAPAGPALAALETDDLYLAAACADGVAGALAAFELHCGPAISRAVISSGAPAADHADLGQVVRQRLLVAPARGGAPRIASYGGRGGLSAWVRVVATREAFRMFSRAHRESSAEDEELARLPGIGDDPEISYLKRLYGAELKRAFQVAVAALDDRARLVLRQHALDGLGIDKLAALHRVHRATAARWIEAARESVLASVHRELIDRLRLSRVELASVIRMVHSRIDVSLARILR